MATIKDLINHIDIADMSVQFMTRGHCDLTIRGKKDQYLEAKFHSSPENMHKEAIIIWVDREKLKTSTDAVIS